jgi:hypothetical protein
MSDVTITILGFVIGVVLAKFCMFLTNAYKRRKNNKRMEIWCAKLQGEAEARAKQYQAYRNVVGDMEMRAYAEHRPVYATQGCVNMQATPSDPVMVSGCTAHEAVQAQILSSGCDTTGYEIDHSLFEQNLPVGPIVDFYPCPTGKSATSR